MNTSTTPSMKTRSILSLAGAVAVLAGAAAFVQLRSSPAGSGTADAPLPKNRKESPAPGSPSSLQSPAPQDSQSRRRDESRFSDLISEYGESRTKLSGHVIGEFAGLIDDLTQLRELLEKHPDAGGISFIDLDDLLGEDAEKLALTDEQKLKASEVIKSYEQRLLDKVTQLSKDAKKNPEPYMNFLLAGDAHSQGKISREEYLRKIESNKPAQDIINPETLLSMQDGGAAADEALIEEFRKLLDPDQQETFNSIIQENDGEDDTTADAGSESESEAASIDLETLDNKIGAVRKAFSGVRTMLEAASALDTDP